MTIDLLPYLDDSQPKYLAIARALSRAIRSGELTPGTRLPPHRQLAEHIGVSVQTVSRAYSQAEKMGLVQARVGSGTWINALDDAREKGLSVIPTCPYAENWISEHPDYQDLLAG